MRVNLVRPRRGHPAIVPLRRASGFPCFRRGLGSV